MEITHDLYRTRLTAPRLTWTTFSQVLQCNPRNHRRQETFDDTDIPEIDGFRQIWNKKSPMVIRLLWLLASSSVLGLCIYQFGERIAYFLGDPSAVNVFYVANKTIEFPAFTFCPRNDQDQWANAMNSSYKNKNFSLKSLQDVDDLLKAGKITIYDIMNSSKEYWSKLEVNIYDPLSNKWEKYESYKFTNIYTVRGLCHTIDPFKSLKNYGSDTAIRLTWHKGQVDTRSYTGIAHAKDNLFWQFEDIAVTSRTSNWLNWWLNDIMGFRLDIKQHILRRKDKQNNCEEDRQIMNCMVTCLKEQVFPSLTNLCRLPVLEGFDQYPACRSVEEILQTQDALANVTNLVRPSACNCPKPCREMVFTMLSLADVPFPTTRAYLAQSIHIMLQHQGMLVIEERSEYSWLNLLCDLGGTLGLWLGICGLEILENITNKLSSLFLRFRLSQTRNECVGVRRRLHAIVVRAAIIKRNQLPEIALPAFRQANKKTKAVIVRALWLTIFVASLSLGLYQIVERILFYFSFPSVTTTNYIVKENTKYPALTICPESNDGLLPAVNPTIAQEIFRKNLSLLDVLPLLEDGKNTADIVWNMSRIIVHEVVYTTEKGFVDFAVIQHAKPITLVRMHSKFNTYEFPKNNHRITVHDS